MKIKKQIKLIKLIKEVKNKLKKIFLFNYLNN